MTSAIFSRSEEIPGDAARRVRDLRKRGQRHARRARCSHDDRLIALGQDERVALRERVTLPERLERAVHIRPEIR